MKIKTVISGLVVIGLSALISIWISSNQETKVAYVDSVRLLASYKPLLEMKGEIELKHKERMVQVDSLKSELEKEMLDFEKNKSGMAKPQAELRWKELAKKQRDLNRVMEAMNLEQSKEEKQLTMDILKPVEQQIRLYAENNNYEIVFNLSGNILYIDTENDITEEIIQYLEDNN
jgi:Skp family chaperone for outer membrane proteins